MHNAAGIEMGLVGRGLGLSYSWVNNAKRVMAPGHLYVLKETLAKGDELIGCLSGPSPLKPVAC